MHSWLNYCSQNKFIRAFVAILKPRNSFHSCISG